VAFGIGFIALVFARSELFTENFLVPMTTVIARQARMVRLVRHRAVTLAGNWPAAGSSWACSSPTFPHCGAPRSRPVSTTSISGWAGKRLP
jgi:hypothetical protein